MAQDTADLPTPESNEIWASLDVFPPVRRVWVLGLQSKGAVLPSTCACCGALAAASRSERKGGAALLVPYCNRCDRAIGAVGTRKIAAALASGVVGFALLIGLPLWIPDSSLLLYAALAAGGATWPALALWLVRRRPTLPRSSEGRAVWWTKPGFLVCTSAQWSEELARTNGAQRVPGRMREPLLGLSAFLGPMLALAVAPFLHPLLYPALMVLNLSGEEFEIREAGRLLVRMESTSLESPGAGKMIRLGSGLHAFDVLDVHGGPLGRFEVELAAGDVHLFAPFSEGHCFWLERDGYGRVAAQQHRTELDRKRQFWRITTPVDGWFEANPIPPADDRSSGGQLTAVRHARCEETAR